MNRPPRRRPILPEARTAAGVLCVAIFLLVPACSRKDKGAADGSGQAAGAETAGGIPSNADTPGSQGPGALADEKDPGAVATIGGNAIPYRQFERYLNDNAGEETDPGTSADEIKSRLLDQFVEEQLILGEADRLKIAVSDAEVDAYLKELGMSDGDLDVGAPDGKEAFRAKVHDSLVVQKVKESAVLNTIHVGAAEVEDELKRRPDAASSVPRFVLRQFLLEDRNAAETARRALLLDPGRFEAMAREKSISPDRGQPRAYSGEELPPEVRAAVESLEPLGISAIVPQSGGFVMFQLVRKEEARPDLAQVRKRIESELFRAKADQVMDRYLAELKGKTAIHVNRAILPFRYVGEAKN
ncbi:MAG TPA: peptidylprolyl isomerase [Candidatus Polarisedimenticolia bacterium]|nr:peptidylprolyl isomerase [Candidatus Polarisedimenticolia bacterium]